MNDAPTRDTPPTEADAGEPRSRLTAQVNGRSVRFRIVVGVLIAGVTLGIGAWWVWGPDRGTPMADGMAGMEGTDVRLPAVAGLYAGEEIFFVHPEASDPGVAGVLTDMMGGSPVLVVPELADTPASVRDDVYVFTNGIEGMGPFGFQPDVFASAPGDDAYSPLRQITLVTWRDEGQARELRSADEVTAAADAGDLDLEQTNVVVNMPVLTWPGGQR